MSIQLEVSIGEALDKYSILEIKERYIQNSIKLEHILQEKVAIYPIISSFLTTCPYLYRLLQKVNTKIWFLVEETRDKDVSYKTIMKENDARFRIKRKINDMCCSYIKEQKNCIAQPYILFIEKSIECTINIKEWILELSIYYDVFHIYTPSLELWIHLEEIDPDICVYPALSSPLGCNWILQHQEDIFDFIAS